MNLRGLIHHKRSETPAYVFWVFEKPRTKHQKLYKEAVAKAAKLHISHPISECDVEVEITYSTLAKSTVRADIDNVIKPTLDGLKGIAFNDDAQVRSVTATLFDRNKNNLVSGRVEHFGRLFYSPKEDALLISIYSDTRLLELGGEEIVKKKLFEEWNRDFKEKLVNTKR